MKPLRLTTFILALLTTTFLAAGLILEATTDDDSLMARPWEILLWLVSVVGWVTHVGAFLTDTLCDRMDRRLADAVQTIVDGVAAAVDDVATQADRQARVDVLRQTTGVEPVRRPHLVDR